MLLKKSKTIRNLLLFKRPDFKLSPRPKLALTARAAPSWAGGCPSWAAQQHAVCPRARWHPRPGRSLGLGRQSGLPRNTSWAAFSPRGQSSLLAIGSDPTAVRRPPPTSAEQNAAAGGNPGNPKSFPSPLFSLMRAAATQRTTAMAAAEE